MPTAKLISTNGPYSDAMLEIDGQVVCVFDEFSLDIRSSPTVGNIFNFDFANELDGNESWEDLFALNPDKRIGIDQIDGWEYRAFGKVISINPVQVDCGLFIEEDVFHTHDERVVGEFIGFKIFRLGAMLPY
jgi:hypothetical protein